MFIEVTVRTTGRKALIPLSSIQAIIRQDDGRCHIAYLEGELTNTQAVETYDQVKEMIHKVLNPNNDSPANYNRFTDLEIP